MYQMLDETLTFIAVKTGRLRHVGRRAMRESGRSKKDWLLEKRWMGSWSGGGRWRGWGSRRSGGGWGRGGVLGGVEGVVEEEEDQREVGGS